MTHSCTYCRKLIIAQPTVYEELRGKWVDAAVLDASYVLRGVSEGCAFLDWCLSLLSDNTLYGDELSLQVAKWSTNLQEIDKAKFVVIRREDEDEEQDRGP
jgi:hypothetical protein